VVTGPTLHGSCRNGATNRKSYIVESLLSRAVRPTRCRVTGHAAQGVARRRGRHPRVAARWLLRYLEEVTDATIEEAAMVAACLAALAGDRHWDAALTLRPVAERATSHSRARGVA
jgi:hypothetical protein